MTLSLRNKLSISSFIICCIIALSSTNVFARHISFVQDQTSELALLMRGMYDFSDDLKNKITNKEELGKFPKNQKLIHTAIATDPSVKTEKYNVFAKEYLKNLAALYKTPVAEQKVQFNLVVTNCITCHQSFCPGPVKRIKKLYFAEF